MELPETGQVSKVVPVPEFPVRSTEASVQLHSSACHSPIDAPVNLKVSVSEPVFNPKKMVKRIFSAY